MSPSSIQLSYEMNETTAALEEYLRGLESAPSGESVGVVWTINGRRLPSCHGLLPPWAL